MARPNRGARVEILDVPPEEAVEHFRAKGLHTRFNWRQTSAEMHARSFTVAKAMQLDLLTDLQAGVDRAIAEGLTLDEFRAGLEPALTDKGWWGLKEVTDPLTGQVREVDFSSPRRLRTIFETNMRTAYAAGDWHRIERNAEAMPWLFYDAVDDARTRPEHRAWDGTVKRTDDPWWDTHYPPNGWGCRCGVLQLSDDDLEEMGIEPPEPPDPEETAARRREIDRAREAGERPAGIDEGWDHNVGRLDLVGQASGWLADRAETAGGDLGADAVRDHLLGPGAEFWMRRLQEAHPDGVPRRLARGIRRSAQPVALIPTAWRERLGFPPRSRPSRSGDEVVVLTSASYVSPPHHLERYRDFTPRDWVRIQAVIDGAVASGQVRTGGGNRHHSPSARMWFAPDQADKPWRVVLKVTKADEIVLATYHRIDPERE